MAERPICKECPYYSFRKASGTVGWEAYCTRLSRHGRIIEWQYGLSSEWTRKELKDRMEIKICPGWCKEWELMKARTSSIP